MIFKKINAHTIRCQIGEDEISALGFEITELTRNQERADEFIKLIMERGRQEGYEVSEPITSVDTTFTSSNQIILQYTNTSLEELLSDTLHNIFSHCMQEIASAKELSEVKKEKQEEETEHVSDSVDTPLRYSLKFRDLDIAEQFSKNVINVQSSLYKLEKSFEMIVDITKLNEVARRSFLLQATEFSDMIRKEQFEMAFYEEHGEIIIKNRAIEVLKQL